MSSFNTAQSQAVTNSFGIATNVMASAAIFSFYQLATPSVGRAHKNAVLLSAIVAFITCAQYCLFVKVQSPCCIQYIVILSI